MKKNGLILFCVMLTVCACSLFYKEEPQPVLEPTRVVLEIEASGDINPNIAGRSSPVVVRIYSLKSYSVFYDAEFISLFEKDSEVLGQDLINKRELILKPNEKRTVFFEASSDIRAIGILAAFRYYDQGEWKVATSIRKNKTNVINVFIGDTTVQIK